MIKKIVLTVALLCCLAGIACADGKKNPTVIMETSLGNVTIELFEKEAPLSVRNFLDYVRSGFYSGTVFHRIIPGFMIQGGGFTSDLKQKPTAAPVRNEAGNGLNNQRGTVAMARTSIVDSATAQFFINTVNNGFLDQRDKTERGFGYAVFATVINGMDVVDKIAAVRTVNRGFPDVPETPVIIKSITIVK